MIIEKIRLEGYSIRKWKLFVVKNVVSKMKRSFSQYLSNPALHASVWTLAMSIIESIIEKNSLKGYSIRNWKSFVGTNVASKTKGLFSQYLNNRRLHASDWTLARYHNRHPA